MAIRVLTGIILTNDSTGRATITFRPHAVEGDGRGVGFSELGANGNFRAPPAKTVSLREISTEDGRAKIDEHMHTESLLEIGWKGVNEISYLIIGEVEE